MMRVTAVGRSDVGRARQGKANEDAYHVGDSTFAVADGMGGHLAGEIASATALGPISELDGRVYSDSDEATKALRDAVMRANLEVVNKSNDAPSYRGMGTTLTAVMVEGRRAHVAHVGDSRAYLLRDGVFSQLTTDHTLVQRLIEEGRLTEEEASRHPQRSVITRAIGVESNIDVDAMTLDLEPGDRLLLCSDGLTGPVSDEAIARLLGHDDLDRVPDDLIDAANDAGGPDNITAVVLAFEALETAPAPDNGPGRDPATVVVTTRPDEEEADWAGRLGRIGSLGTDHGAAGYQPGHRSRTILVTLVVVVALVAAGLFLGRSLLSRSWFVGVADDGQVTIFQGVPVETGPVRLYWPHERTEWEIEDVPLVIRQDVRDGLTATDAADAQLIVDNFATLRADEDEPGAEATEDATAPAGDATGTPDAGAEPSPAG